MANSRNNQHQDLNNKEIFEYAHEILAVLTARLREIHTEFSATLQKTHYFYGIDI
jgi:hypothetical protein